MKLISTHFPPLFWLYMVLAGQRLQVRLGRTVNQRRAVKARERWHEQGGTWGLVEGIYRCVGLLLPMNICICPLVQKTHTLDLKN